MMKPYVWQEGMNTEEAKDGAYWERNMLALLLAKTMSMIHPSVTGCGQSGWYWHGEWEGWNRVISINDGKLTFHVPDEFDLGSLPQIEPNWDGHTTEQKWINVMRECGCWFPADESQAYGNDCKGGQCE